ncbi:hypothetical protein [Streptomyces sp. NPDC054842]
MISTRRIVAAVGLVVSATGLAAPAANALGADTLGVAPISPVAQLDALAQSNVPAEHREQLPHVSSQLAGLKRLHDLNQLHQATDLVAPVVGLLPVG